MEALLWFRKPASANMSSTIGYSSERLTRNKLPFTDARIRVLSFSWYLKSFMTKSALYRVDIVALSWSITKIADSFVLSFVSRTKICFWLWTYWRVDGEQKEVLFRGPSVHWQLVLLFSDVSLLHSPPYEVMFQFRRSYFLRQWFPVSAMMISGDSNWANPEILQNCTSLNPPSLKPHWGWVPIICLGVPSLQKNTSCPSKAAIIFPGFLRSSWITEAENSCLYVTLSFIGCMKKDSSRLWITTLLLSSANVL